MLNELVIKNTTTKKTRPSFSLRKDFTYHKAESHYKKRKTFHYEVLSKLCRNLGFLINFSLVLSTLRRQKDNSKFRKGLSRLFKFLS